MNGKTNSPLDVLAVMEVAATLLDLHDEARAADLRSAAAQLEAVRADLDRMNDIAANRHHGFGDKDNRFWFYETTGAALAKFGDA